MSDSAISRYAGDHLQGGKCAHCAALSFPADEICRQCLSETVEPYLLPRTGTLYSFTVVHGKDSIPAAYGYADLPDGLRVFGRIEGDAMPTVDGRLGLSASEGAPPLCRFHMEVGN